MSAKRLEVMISIKEGRGGKIYFDSWSIQLNEGLSNRRRGRYTGGLYRSA
ncbi:MAG: hypothetical protein MUF23_11785 [Pirellula sp.]|nr:hypothetical protein [Pirellula sp.]